MNKFIKENKIAGGIILVLVIFLVIIYFGKQPNAKPVDPQENAQTGNSLFEKQVICVNYTENAKKQLEDSYTLATPYFYEIFYSPKTKTCVYIDGVILSGSAPNDIGIFHINDYFTKETLFFINYDNTSSDEKMNSYDRRLIFSNEVKKYK